MVVVVEEAGESGERVWHREAALSIASVDQTGDALENEDVGRISRSSKAEECKYEKWRPGMRGNCGAKEV